MGRRLSSVPLQIFTPSRAQAVVATEAWTPGVDDRVFAVTADCNYKINGGAAIDLTQGSARGIREGCTYTFSVSQNLEVMT